MRAVLWILCALPLVALGQGTTDQALDQSQALMRDAQNSQQRIEQLDDATRLALERYRQAIAQREQLVEYNARLADMVNAQAEELEAFEAQLNSIEDTQRELLPLMRRMYASLEQFIALDLPFLSEERGERLAQLDNLLKSANVSVAEKYRRLVEAYQIESDYGRTLEAWRGTLNENEPVRVVDFLRLGRVMLFYQTLDGREQGYWDAQTNAWKALPDSYRRTLEQGLKIARQQQTPVMLRLPLPPVSEQESGL
jgi:small-conductance mechanosensitive channel